MDKEVLKKERVLDRKRLDNEIATQEAEIAQKKAIVAEMKRRYGRNWRNVLGVKGLADLYAIDPTLRDLAKPPRVRYL